MKYDMLAAALFLAFVVYLLVHAQNKGSGGMDSRQQRHGLHVMEEFAAFTAAWFILTLVADRSMLKRWRIGFWLCCACLAITVVLRVNCVLFLWEHGQNRYPFNTTVLQMVRVVPMAAVLYAVAELGYHLLYLKVIWSIRQAHPRWPSRAEAETGSSGFAVAVWGIFAGVLIAATLWAVYLVTQGPFEAVELEVNPEPGVISRKTVRTSTYNPPFAIAPGVIAFVVCCVFLYKFMKWKRGEDDDWY